jgi:hypothetical protein
MGRAGVQIAVEHRWSCPNCNATDLTHETRPHSRFHSCAGLKGLSAPFVTDGVRCKIEAVERDDYLNGDRTQCDGEGRPIMSIVTTRDDGQDCAVLAPCAVGSIR